MFSQFVGNLIFIFLDSHKKFSLVLLHITNYIYSTWKKWRRMQYSLNSFWYKVFVHWKLKLLNFLLDSILKILWWDLSSDDLLKGHGSKGEEITFNNCLHMPLLAELLNSLDSLYMTDPFLSFFVVVFIIFILFFFCLSCKPLLPWATIDHLFEN